MIEDIINEYEVELKLMMYNGYPKDAVISQFSNYQKTLRDNDVMKDIKNNYKKIFEMYKSFLKKGRCYE